ncbi:hypothetical protein SAMN05421854_110127 [Amycolatopsis rubida]|uniref:Uncharacterized protein n=2 Tax=Amycolatopsis rubida TaxID=112413 RepID=A0A1I5XAL4_9PSEU|nr:hypothetical protein SAMN05421854_110127 [Amycolatopsis rubida]
MIRAATAPPRAIRACSPALASPGEHDTRSARTTVNPLPDNAAAPSTTGPVHNRRMNPLPDNAADLANSDRASGARLRPDNTIRFAAGPPALVSPKPRSHGSGRA